MVSLGEHCIHDKEVGDYIASLTGFRFLLANIPLIAKKVGT